MIRSLPPSAQGKRKKVDFGAGLERAHVATASAASTSRSGSGGLQTARQCRSASCPRELPPAPPSP